MDKQFEASIRAIITSWKHNNPAKDFKIAEVYYEGFNGLVPSVVKGTALRNLEIGDCFHADGEWVENTFRGKTENQLMVKVVRPEHPRTVEGIRFYLQGIFNEKFGIARKAIHDLVEKYAHDTLAKIEDDVQLLVKLSRDPVKYGDPIRNEWTKRSGGRKAAKILKDSGLVERDINRILTAFKDSTLSVLKDNPYKVASVPSLGFEQADAIARKLGIALNDDRRLEAGIEAVLQQVAKEQGSTAAKLVDVLTATSKKISVSENDINRFLIRTLQKGSTGLVVSLVDDQLVVQLGTLHRAEKKIAETVVRLRAKGRHNDRNKVMAAAARVFAEFKAKNGYPMDETQQRAVIEAMCNPVFILSGGPGTGKSTVMESVAKLCEQIDGNLIVIDGKEEHQLHLCAFTGKAAKRLNETTERITSTIHRLLGARYDASLGKTVFTRNRQKPLPPRSVVVIDEVSMVDAELMAALCDALPPDGRLILVGDRFQLPSVSAGRVLADLLAARFGTERAIPFIELEKVYRQKENSKISTDAKKINNGELPEVGEEIEGGVSFHEVHETKVTSKILEFIDDHLTQPIELDGPGKPPVQVDLLTDMVVLCPQAKGPGGTWEVNTALSKRLNPDGKLIPGVQRLPFMDPKEPVPRMGDRVLLTVNENSQDEEKDVKNGDTGTIVSCRSEEKNGTKRHFFTVHFDTGQKIEYPAYRWNDFLLGYAMTVHKSQGSQYKVIMLPVCQSHRGLSRKLLYTGWTRAKNLVVGFGSYHALDAAIQRVNDDERVTRLTAFIEEAGVAYGFAPPVPPSNDNANEAPHAEPDETPAPVQAEAPKPSVVAPRLSPVTKPMAPVTKPTLVRPVTPVTPRPAGAGAAPRLAVPPVKPPVSPAGPKITVPSAPNGDGAAKPPMVSKPVAGVAARPATGAVRPVVVPIARPAMPVRPAAPVKAVPDAEAPIEPTVAVMEAAEEQSPASTPVAKPPEKANQKFVPRIVRTTTVGPQFGPKR
jgi:exodeoxyribonuclease V alpha subunit